MGGCGSVEWPRVSEQRPQEGSSPSCVPDSLAIRLPALLGPWFLQVYPEQVALEGHAWVVVEDRNSECWLPLALT